MKHQKTIEQEVIQFIKKNDLVSGARKVLIGFSGGADSVFALHFFYKYSNKYKIEIAAIHVNHNLRGKESERDEEFCREFCKKLEIEFHIFQVDVNSFAKKNKKSVEEAARILRYREFEKALESSNSDLIITAHNNDDNTETVLLNIVSGSGLNGISGIPCKRENIIRPFLCLAKADIIRYLKENNIKFVEDSSNKNLDFRRNYLRKKIIPALKNNINSAIDQVVLHSSEVFRNQTKIIEYFIKEIIGKIVKKSGDKLFVSISELNKYPEEILGEVVKTILISNFAIDFNFNQFEKIKSLLNSEVGSYVGLGKKVFAFRERGKIVIVKKEEVPEIEEEIEIGQKIKVGSALISIEKVKKKPKTYNSSSNIEYISGDKIKNKMILRMWKLGDKIQLFGMKGTKKISDVLTDLKIPSYKRKSQLVLVNNSEIVWIVGIRISEKYKITSKSKNIVKLCQS